MTSSWLVLLPSEALEVMDLAGTWGRITCRVSAPDQAAIVMAISNEESPLVPLHEDPDHFLSVADFEPAGYWYRVTPEVHELAWIMTMQDAAIPFDEFQRYVPTVHRPAGDGFHLVISYCENPSEIAEGRRMPKWVAWTVSRDGVNTGQVDLRDGREMVAALEHVWPAATLSTKRALVIGAGSIGGAVAEALASYGVGSQDLVDPDRLLFHNVPRHVLSTAKVGQPKVDALAAHLRTFWPEVQATAHAVDVIHSADVVRQLIDASDIVVCSVDGVEPRRVVSHLARRAGKPVVFACVLADGRYGEILRIRPLPEVGCLECQRRHLQDSGRMDPESGIDKGYGEGTRHNPMTAVGGDLHLVGAVAAKAAVATLLQGAGGPGQLLQDDNLVLALRPSGGFEAPFDATRTLNSTWYRATAPYPDCPSCVMRSADG